MRLAKLLNFAPTNTSTWLLATAAVMGMLPLDYLISAWSDDVSRSGAMWLATIACGALLGRLVGEQMPGSATNQRYAMSLLLCGAALRGVATPLRIGACIDAGFMLDRYALGVLAGSPREQRPLPPARLALAGALWVPTEVVLGRALNSMLQPVTTF
ncbi:MAG: hypothetical protein ACHQIO_17425 [Nevskiales bacterium]